MTWKGKGEWWKKERRKGGGGVGRQYMGTRERPEETWIGKYDASRSEDIL